MSAMQWDDLRQVLAVHNAGSVASAARALGVSNVTVFRRLRALEKQLGVRLFDHTRRGYVATPAGLEIVTQAERIEAEVGSLERRLWSRDKQLQGEVRITTTDNTAAFVVAPLLPALYRAHPGIGIDLNLDVRVLNISKRDADIALRPTTQPPESLIGHRVAALTYAPYGARALVAPRRGGKPDLERLPWVSLDRSYGGTLQGSAYQRYMASRVPPERIALRSNSALMMAHAVRAGVGLGVMSIIAANRLGGLVRIGPYIDELASELWVLTHPELRDVARVSAVYNFLRRTIPTTVP